ncbi:MAG: DUF423 domain-containing protein [Acidobacteriota bacterium]|nr:DUF423 domain-containing protein [Acidobacteriota bacterium]
MSSIWIAAGAFVSALSIAAGAFGAHGLAARLDERGLALWETSARYLIYSGLGLILLGVVARGDESRGFDLVGGMLLVGSVIFSGTVAVLALGGPRWLGAVTPIGGVLMILGFVTFGWLALKS